MSKNNLCYETRGIMFIKMTAIMPKSKFLLGRLKMAQLVKIPIIVFRLVPLDFAGQTYHLDMVMVSLEPPF